MVNENKAISQLKRLKTTIGEQGKAGLKARIKFFCVAIGSGLKESLVNYDLFDQHNIGERDLCTCFEMYDGNGNIVTQWFGGGQDLTPYYLFNEDAMHFHTVCKTACDKHNADFYPKFKETCDNYFWNAHRNEARGIGGLFFDYLKETSNFSMQDRYDFVTEVGNSFLNSYVPIVEKRKDLTYKKEHKDWQEVRRGRYVEFNLVHDRGTLFGLKTNGRIESILMSLPPVVQWVYNQEPKEGSEEFKLLEVLKQPKNWL